MKVNLNIPILDFTGNPILGNDKEPVKMRDTIASAVNMEDNEHRLSVEQKARAFKIGVGLYGGDEVDLSIEDASFIKERVAIFFSPLVYGRVAEIFGD